jgi:class 3 adenylate cyclase
MLKVLPGHAQDYAKVLTRITEAMREAVKDEYGIFDKFTGDGVLAFFPHFFSGATHIDGGYRALAAAERCHKIFAAEYEHLWKHLIAVPAPGSTEYEIPGAIGLGIGIDYGIVHLVNVGEELTIVGAPAVFACRLSSTARACTTLLNQRGFDALNGAPYLAWQRENARLKHEDAPTVAYRVRLSNEPHRLPNWSLGNNAERWRAWLEP